MFLICKAPNYFAGSVLISQIPNPIQLWILSENCYPKVRNYNIGAAGIISFVSDSLNDKKKHESRVRIQINFFKILIRNTAVYSNVSFCVKCVIGVLRRICFFLTLHFVWTRWWFSSRPACRSSSTTSCWTTLTCRWCASTGSRSRPSGPPPSSSSATPTLAYCSVPTSRPEVEF